MKQNLIVWGIVIIFIIVAVIKNLDEIKDSNLLKNIKNINLFKKKK